MKYVYQLKVIGVSCLDGKYENRSNTVFTSKEEAEKRIPKMIDMCCDESALVYLVRGTEKVHIIRLEIVE